MTARISYLMCMLFFLISFLHLGTSLRCYHCQSKFNGECDAVREKTIADESCDHSRLFKAFQDAGSKYVCVVHKMPQGDYSDLSVVRGCAPENYCSYFENSSECVTCAEDLCNSSSAVLPSIILSIASVLCAKYYF